LRIPADFDLHPLLWCRDNLGFVFDKKIGFPFSSSQPIKRKEKKKKKSGHLNQT